MEPFVNPYLYFFYLMALRQGNAQTATKSSGTCKDNTVYEEPYIIESLIATYEKNRVPSPLGVDVSVELIVNEISALSEITSEFELDLFFSEIWYDRKLAYEDQDTCTRNITLDLSYLNKLWQPNICIVNSKQALIHKSPSENVFLILYDDGKIWRNCRMRVRAPCVINLKNFPFDTQPCTLIFESYSYNANKVRLQWMNDTPVKLLGNVELPDFELLSFHVDHNVVPYPNGRWEQLALTFHFKRRYGFFVLQAYVPTYMVIFIAWINFWMDPKELSTRATLTISAFLAMTLQFGNVLSSMPRVSYIKAIDIWMLGGIIFLFISLAELAIISYVLRSDRPVQKDRKRTKKVTKNGRSTQRYDAQPKLIEHGNNEKVNIELKRVPKDCFVGNQSFTQLNNVPSYSVRSSPVSSTAASKESPGPLWFGRWSPYQIDIFFVITFPPCFLAFNVYYWATYL